MTMWPHTTAAVARFRRALDQLLAARRESRAWGLILKAERIRPGTIAELVSRTASARSYRRRA